MAETTVTRRSDGSWSVRASDDSRQVAHAVSSADGVVWVHVGGEVFALAGPQPRRVRTASHASAGLEAPMPAQVLSVAVSVGDEVTAGTTLLLLEAMKMELPLRAPYPARVRAVHCAAGDRVAPGRALVDLESLEDQP